MKRSINTNLCEFIPNSQVLNVSIGSMISKDDAVKLLGIISNDIAKDKKHVGNANITYRVEIDTNVKLNLSRDVESDCPSIAVDFPMETEPSIAVEN